MLSTCQWIIYCNILFIFTADSASATEASPVPPISAVPPSEWEENIREWEGHLTGVPSYDINTALVHLWQRDDQDNILQLYQQIDQCHRCDVQPGPIIDANGTSTLIQTDFGNHLEIHRILDDTVLCRDHLVLRERGEYWLVVYKIDTGTVACDLVITNDPPDYSLVILWAFLFLCGIAVIWLVAFTLYRRRRNHTQGRHKLADKHHSSSTTVLQISVSSLAVSDAVPDVKGRDKSEESPGEESDDVIIIRQKSRRRALDTFRGLSLTVVIFVNYGGGGYYFFDHCPWDGIYVADLVFPWFVWIMGVSLAFSFNSQLIKGVPKWRIFLKILDRDVKKFCIGLCLNAPSIQDMAEVRIFSILQRLAAAHFITATIHLMFVSDNGYKPKMAPRCGNHRFRDITEYWMEWVVMFGIMAAHICLTYLLPVPGCPTGYVGPGGLHEGGQFYNCTGGAAQYIDTLVLGPQHMSSTNSMEGLYGNQMRYDSEGILSTLNVVFTCFLGLQAGKIISIYSLDHSRLIRWILWALFTGVVGTILCQGRQFDSWVPINKNLWSVSFVMCLSCMAFIMLALLYLLIDVAQVWNGAPFIYPGINSISIYVLHTVFKDYFPVMWEWPDYTLHWQRLFRAIWGCVFWNLVAYAMFVKKIFIVL